MNANNQNYVEARPNYLKESYLKYIGMGLATIGALLNLVGLIIQQKRYVNYSLAFTSQFWYSTLYYIFVLIAFGVLSASSSFPKHRLTLLALLAIGVVYLTEDVKSYVGVIRIVSDADVKTSMAGCIIMIIGWFLLIGYTGSDPQIS